MPVASPIKALDGSGSTTKVKLNQVTDQAPCGWIQGQAAFVVCQLIGTVSPFDESHGRSFNTSPLGRHVLLSSVREQDPFDPRDSTSRE